MQLFFNEQDVADSICSYIAYNEKRVHPNDVVTELNTLDFENFYAIVTFDGLERELDEGDMINAIITYLENEHNFDPNRLKARIYFEKDQGIVADVKVQGNISLNK